MRVGVVYKLESAKLAGEVEKFLKAMEIEVELHHIPTPSLEKYDIIVTIGGDGTILRTLQELKDPPPVFGINTGKIGILTHSNPENFKEGLKRAVSGELEVEEFMRIQGESKNESLVALNEIAILSVSQARLIEFEIHADENVIDRLRADGAIISTPLGSTAYSLSAGGPIIDPYQDVICFTPISPFRIGFRPWVFSGNRSIKLRLLPLRDAVAIADGYKSIELSAGDEIVAKKSDYPARFFKMEKRIERISEKIKVLR